MIRSLLIEELQNWGGLWIIYITKYSTETHIQTHLGVENSEKENKHVMLKCLN